MSSEVKKFLLVDAASIDQLIKPIEQKDRLTPIVNKELKRLDQLMYSIVSDQTLSEQQKVFEYNKTLAQFQSIPQDKPKSTVAKEISSPITDKPLPVKPKYEPTIGISDRYKAKAKNLMSLLDNSNAIKVADNGEISIKDEPIPNSNISDLLNRAVNPYYKKNQLPGWSKFQNVLNESNVPRSLFVTRSSTTDINKDTPTKPAYKKTSPATSTKVLRWSPYDSKQNVKKKITTREKN